MQTLLEGALAQALSLGRGAPFAGSPSSTYGWVFQGPIASSLSNSARSAAAKLATLALAKVNTPLELCSVVQGNFVWPTDVVLGALELEAAARSGPRHLTRT